MKASLYRHTHHEIAEMQSTQAEAASLCEAKTQQFFFSDSWECTHSEQKINKFLPEIIYAIGIGSISKPFLSSDSQSISLAQAVNYLRHCGELNTFIINVWQQHILEQELQNRNDLDVDSASIDEFLIDFRLQNQLANQRSFQEWLKFKGISYDDFRAQIAYDLKLNKLKREVSAPLMEAYFNNNKILFDRIVLERIVVDDLDLALNLRTKIIEDGSLFAQLAKDYSLTEDRIVNGHMGILMLEQIPEQLRKYIVTASPGALIGPVQLDYHYILLRVTQFIPAVLSGQVKQQLQEQLFEQWLFDKVRQLRLKIHIG
ncbi:peptidylprolyl isomerase [Aerosakkonema sp. BLCC-F183]|uniref:peptidylprolyl isomerase n=1 Tax=Aerosakkonema sp. BLCC-F183 TaxID=3342834 RepID=UPI0035BB1E72